MVRFSYNLIFMPSTAWIARKPSSLQAHLHQTCENLLGPPWESPCPSQPPPCDDDFKLEEAARRQAIEAQSRYRQQHHSHYQNAFESYLDACLSRACCSLQSGLDASDLNSFWCTFWTTVEDAVAQFTQADCATAKHFRGRATQLVRKTRTQKLAHKPEPEIC